MREKDVRFQEQVQKHEEELLRVTTQSQVDSGLQQVHTAATFKMKLWFPQQSVSILTFNCIHVLSSAVGPASSTEAL